MFTFEDFEKLINAALKLANEPVHRSDEDYARNNDEECQMLQASINMHKDNLAAQIEIYRDYFEDGCPVYE